MQKTKLKNLSSSRQNHQAESTHQMTEPSDEDSFVIRPKAFSSFCGRMSEEIDRGQLKSIEGEFLAVNTLYKKMGETVFEQKDAISSINTSIVKTRQNAKKGKEDLKKALVDQERIIPFELKALICILILIVISSLPALL
jgi:hypothetical protein